MDFTSISELSPEELREFRMAVALYEHFGFKAPAVYRDSRPIGKDPLPSKGPNVLHEQVSKSVPPAGTKSSISDRGQLVSDNFQGNPIPNSIRKDPERYTDYPTSADPL